MKFGKRKIAWGTFRSHSGHRRGAACVEFAVVAPILVLLVLGIIDVGQFVNVGQTVSNASREGARIAARQSTTNATDVETAVKNYLTDIHPALPASAVTVTVADAGGTITGAGLAAVPTGGPVAVRVDVQFDPVRWISALSYLGGRDITTSTLVRRE